MKQIIRDYLTFNKRERNGLLVLILILTILIVFLNTSHLFIQPETVNFSKYEKELAQFNSQFESGPIHENHENMHKFNSTTKELKGGTNKNIKPFFFNFNPNGLSVKDWKNLGFSDKQIHVIKNYEAKGGQFFTKADLKKMYCISAEQYLMIEPYIQLPKEKILTHNTEVKTKRYKIETIELNSTDSLQLASLKGIGAFYAKAIIKYRTLLGGFIYKEQLLEIWKFDSIKFNGIKDKITVDVSITKKININTCTASELKHPYLSWNMARSICNYRNKHGQFKSIEEIKRTDMVDEDTFNKIAPYITLE